MKKPTYCRPLKVTISGPSCSGKTLLAKKITEYLREGKISHYYEIRKNKLTRVYDDEIILSGAEFVEYEISELEKKSEEERNQI